MKICSKCKIEKDLNEFYKSKKEKDGFQYICKQCASKYDKKHQIENKEKTINRMFKYREKKKKHTKEYNKKYQKEYKNNKTNYDTYASQISWDNNPIRNVDGFLQTKCTYCGKWYFPTVIYVQSRIKALNGQTNSTGTENRLYCSNECKEACPIYGQIKYPRGFKNYTQSREVQPELRQMVFERDEYTCIKCGKHQDDLLNIPLHCHHIEGIQHNPIMSADIDICVTVCKTCHNEIHQENGCGYHDMKCKK